MNFLQKQWVHKHFRELKVFFWLAFPLYGKDVEISGIDDTRPDDL